MKIVIGGATNVGKSIVGYLSLGNNDIVVVDENSAKLNELAKEYDIQTVLGSISHPEVQENIGMKNMDMLIAVTDSDEINMVACQVAYTLFNVPRKIARIDSQYFLNPLWNSLYNEKSLPIDLVITPDVEIAKFIADLLELPGCSAVYPFFNRNLNILAFRNLNTESPLIKFSTAHINTKLAELQANIVLLMRGNRCILAADKDIFLQRNDMVYISCPSQNNMEVMRLFGVDHNPYEKIVVFGANTISYYLAKQLETNENIVNCSIIDDNEERAAKLAQHLNSAAVIAGEITSDVILNDVGFATTDVSLAITDRDKDNLLISLLASKNKDTQAFSLVNSKDYNILTMNIRNNIVIDRSVITISAIMQYLRKARIQEAYALGRGMGEIWEIRLGNDSSNLGKTIKNLRMPEKSAVLLVARGNEFIYATEDLHLQAADKILLYVAPDDIKRVENIFYL